MAVRAAGSVTVASITDVASTTRYYLLQSSTLTAPSAPTANSPGGSWVATEPTYTEGSTNSLYTCDETVFSDGTWAYSAVSLSTSYEAAKAAWNKAAAAAAAAAATDNHFWWDADGAHVSSTGDHDTSGFHALWTATKLAFKNALAELLTIDAVNGVIGFLGGAVTIRGVEWHRGGTDYAGVGMHSTQDGVEITCDSSWEGEPTRVAVESTDPSGEAGGCVYLDGQWLFPRDPSITTADAGYEAHMSALCALMAGADTHIRAGVDVATLEKRIATAIQPVVLYNGGAALDYDTAPGAGTTGTVTLSEDVSHFKELTILGNYNELQTATTLASPNGRDCTLQLFVPDAGPADMVYIKSSRLQVSGTHITNIGWVAMWLSASTTHFDATSAPEIAIVRVEGRR